MEKIKLFVFKILFLLAITSGLLIHFPMLYVITEGEPYWYKTGVPLIAGYFLFMSIAIFTNLLIKGYSALRERTFYTNSLISLVPILGPIYVLGAINLLPHKGEFLSKKIIKRNKRSTLSVCVFLAIVGILYYLISAPGFNSYKYRALKVAVQSDLRNLCTAELVFFDIYKKFSSDFNEVGKALSMDINPSKDVTIEIVSANENCFKAKGNHAKLDETYWIDCEGKLSRQEKGSSELVLM